MVHGFNGKRKFAVGSGPWEQIFYREFNGRRRKHVVIRLSVNELSNLTDLRFHGHFSASLRFAGTSGIKSLVSNCIPDDWP